MVRIDRRTASRKAALAFSIRCQRSATIWPAVPLWLRLDHSHYPGRPWPVSADFQAYIRPPSYSPDMSPRCYDADFRVAQQPSLDRGGLAIRQKVDDTPAFEIADDASVALTAPPSPVVDAYDA